MPSAHPDAALHLHGYHKIRPSEVETPFALWVKTVLGNWLGQFKAAKNLGEGHAWGGASQKVYHFTDMPRGGLISRKVLRLVPVRQKDTRIGKHLVTIMTPDPSTAGVAASESDGAVFCQSAVVSRYQESAERRASRLHGISPASFAFCSPKMRICALFTSAKYRSVFSGDRFISLGCAGPEHTKHASAFLISACFVS